MGGSTVGEVKRLHSGYARKSIGWHEVKLEGRTGLLVPDPYFLL